MKKIKKAQAGTKSSPRASADNTRVSRPDYVKYSSVRNRQIADSLDNEGRRKAHISFWKGQELSQKDWERNYGPDSDLMQSAKADWNNAKKARKSAEEIEGKKPKLKSGGHFKKRAVKVVKTTGKKKMAKSK